MDQTEQNQQSGNGGIMKSIIALVIIGVGAFSFFKYFSGSVSQDQTATAPSGQTNVPADLPGGTVPAAISSRYKDGSYSAEGVYQSPGGSESIKVTLVLKNDLVAEATVLSLATRPASVKFQKVFISEFSQYVIGKNIGELKLDKVGSSSLTPKGFNDAVEKIKLEAQV